MPEALTRQLLEQAKISYGCKTIPTLRGSQPIDCPYSAVSRIEIGCDGLTKALYLKRVKADGIGESEARKRVLLEYRVLAQLFEHFRAHPTYGIARPIAVFPEEHAIATEEVPGTQLMDMIGRSAKRYMFGLHRPVLEQYCALAGAWLQEFQSFTTQGTGDFNIEGLKHYCSERLDTLISAGANGIDAAFKFRFTAYLEKRYGEIKNRANAVVGRHNDFSPHNIIVNGDHISVIDFGFFDHDSHLYDVCKFWFQLECMKSSPLFHASTIDRLQTSFLEGYGGSVNPRDPGFEMVASRYFVTRLVTMVKEGMRHGLRGWIDRRSYRWCLRWLTERCGTS